jgi:hypothetical protein
MVEGVQVERRHASNCIVLSTTLDVGWNKVSPTNNENTGMMSSTETYLAFRNVTSDFGHMSFMSMSKDRLIHG